MTTPLVLKRDVIPSDADLRNAIEIRCSKCFIAMLYANAFAGSRDGVWDLIYEFKLPELLQEAERRGMDLSTWKTAVEDEVLIETKAYLQAKGETEKALAGEGETSSIPG